MLDRRLNRQSNYSSAAGPWGGLGPHDPRGYRGRAAPAPAHPGTGRARQLQLMG